MDDFPQITDIDSCRTKHDCVFFALRSKGFGSVGSIQQRYRNIFREDVSPQTISHALTRFITKGWVVQVKPARYELTKLGRQRPKVTPDPFARFPRTGYAYKRLPQLDRFVLEHMVVRGVEKSCEIAKQATEAMGKTIRTNNVCRVLLRMEEFGLVGRGRPGVWYITERCRKLISEINWADKY